MAEVTSGSFLFWVRADVTNKMIVRIHGQIFETQRRPNVST